MYFCVFFMYTIEQDPLFGAVYIAVGKEKGFRHGAEKCMKLAQKERLYPNPILAVSYHREGVKLVLGDNRVRCSSLVELLHERYFDKPLAFLFCKRPTSVTEDDVVRVADEFAKILNGSS